MKFILRNEEKAVETKSADDLKLRYARFISRPQSNGEDVEAEARKIVDRGEAYACGLVPGGSGKKEQPYCGISVYVR